MKYLPPSMLAVAALSGFRDTPPPRGDTHPNILLIMVDQMQTPPEGYTSEQGAVQDLKEILGFRQLTPGNSYTGYFSGLMRLRQNAVVCKKHYTASAASVPSQSCIMTGQYPDITGVTQTDGLFKSATDVPFLDPNGTPTIGDWFKAAGYSTHYFGKWHVSEAEPPDYLEPWGFSDWEQSYPEPHGGSSDNLGTFRDVVFTENVVNFLNEKGTDTSAVPWLTVASLVNPHDISSWPINWMVPPGNSGVVPWTGYPPPPGIPLKGDLSRIDTVMMVENGDTIYRIFQVDLNPDGFPQDNSSLPPTFYESLTTKPWCQYDYSYKWGLAWGSKTDYNFISTGAPFRSPHPFQLQGSNYVPWALSYLQFYFYCQYLADLQIRKILNALDSNKLTNNTIVVFLSDHGDLVTAHGGMIQKWHSAYEEIVRVPMIISSPLVNPNQQLMREISYPTSSIDLAPTLLGLAGIKYDTLVPKLSNEKHGAAGGKMDMSHGHSVVRAFAGADLSPYITGSSQGPIIGPDGKPRTGVLMTGRDMITERASDFPANTTYQLFMDRVDSTISLGVPLTAGTVRQPNNMNAFCTGDWKIVQYVDPAGTEKDQWELYCLTNDPNELINLDDYTTGEVRNEVTVPGMTREQLIAKNAVLKAELAHALSAPEPGQMPGQLQLFSNFPNPFTQQTTISFYLPESGHVRLAVLDLSGKEIEVLVNGTLRPGVHTCSFGHNSLPSGVYLCRLDAGGRQLVNKMILMK